ncbi:MAG: PIG-L family deacetylase [Acidobacteriaceae bacterium]|nr:PIG-L family deacetylase [Acidobacteriaceae bacterium]
MRIIQDALAAPEQTVTRDAFYPTLERILILAPHTDDAELGCGATIARLVEAGREVYLAAFSRAEASLPLGSKPNRLGEEFVKATDTLGIVEERAVIYNYPVRELTYHRQEILEELIALRCKIKPQAVLLPAATDLHQDHQVVHLEGVRAFKDITVWGYELPWNHVTFSAHAFVTVQLRHLQKKWDALKCYESQFELGRSYFSWEFIAGLARVRGTQVHEQYAEAFEVIRVKC